MTTEPVTGSTGVQPAFYRLGAFCHRRKWLVIALWMVGFALALPSVGKLPDRLSQGGFEVPGSQSDQVRIALQTEFNDQSQFSDLLVIRSTSLTANDAEFRRVFQNVKAELEKAPGVAKVADPYASPDRTISRDGHTAIAQVALSDTQDAALKHANEVSAAVKRGVGNAKVEALITGSAPFYAAFTETTENDLKRAEAIALPITIAILVVAFGSLIAAGAPVALALLSLVIAFGLVSVVASQTTVSVFTQNIASMIGIGVGIDYSLFILTRFRTELKTGRGVAESVAHAMATSGKAVFVSALTVAVALSGTLLVNLAAFRSMGGGAMIAVAVAGAAAL
ncbi:MAG: MMPL family transporter, partial [Actinomycetota bacterium]